MEGRTLLISVNEGESGNANASSWGPVLTPDGTRVAFVSAASDLVAGDTNVFHDVFVRDVAGGTTTLVSIGPFTQAAYTMFESESPVITPDGRYVAFQSLANDLVENDPNATSDVFVRDLVEGTTQLVSMNQDGTGSAALGGTSQAISGDGHRVAFQSRSHDLVTIPQLSEGGVFVRDMLVGETRWAGSDRVELRFWLSHEPVLAEDGSAVVFRAWMPVVTALFRTDLEASVTERLDAPMQGNGDPASFSSTSASLSADGRRVAFVSNHPGLVPDDVNNLSDVFVRDIVIGETRLITVNTNGVSGNGDAIEAAISADGRWVAFTSLAGDLVPADPDRGSSLSRLWHDRDVFLHDLETGSTILVSRSGREDRSANGASDQPGISEDGRFVVYRSFANDLVAGDDNGQKDVFVYDRLAGFTTLVSASHVSLGSAGGSSHRPLLSAEGSVLAFKSYASDLIGLDYNDAGDVFWAGVDSPGWLSSFIVDLRAISADSVTVSWRATSGEGYAIEYRDELTAGDWQSLNVAIDYEEGRARAIDVQPPGVKERYYRVTRE